MIAVGSLRGNETNVAVKAPRFALALLVLLLSPVMHWAVLINTNGGYGCEDGIQTLISEVFAYRKLCDSYTYASVYDEYSLFMVNTLDNCDGKNIIFMIISQSYYSYS